MLENQCLAFLIIIKEREFEFFNFHVRIRKFNLIIIKYLEHIAQEVNGSLIEL